MDENKKSIRIGKVTFGIILVLVGVVIFVQTLTSLDILRYVLMLWPLVLVCLGIEILVYRNNANIKYDIWGSIYTLIIIGIVSLFSIANYGINKVFYDKNVQACLIEHTSNLEFNDHFKDVVTFTNINGKTEVKINEIASAENTSVKIKVFTNSTNALNMFEKDISDYIFVDSTANQITLLDSFEEYEKIEITIITKNKENIIIK